MQEELGCHHSGFLPSLPIASQKLLERGPRAKRGTNASSITLVDSRLTAQRTNGWPRSHSSQAERGVGKCRNRERCYGVSGRSFHDSREGVKLTR